MARIDLAAGTLAKSLPYTSQRMIPKACLEHYGSALQKVATMVRVRLFNLNHYGPCTVLASSFA